METTFGKQPELLKRMFMDLKMRLERLVLSFVFEQKAAATTVPGPVGDGITSEVHVHPWHLPFSPSFSLKGRSKMVYILRTFQDFLERPYDSMSNPISVNFSSMLPGGPMPDFQLQVNIGFTKTMAMKLVLYSATCQTNSWWYWRLT